MKEIIIKGTPTPIHFGMKVINELIRTTNGDINILEVKTQELGKFGALAEIAADGFNEGARKSGSDRRYTKDDVWDMFDDDVSVSFQVEQIYAESVSPLLDELMRQYGKKSAATAKKSKNPASQTPTVALTIPDGSQSE